MTNAVWLLAGLALIMDTVAVVAVGAGINTGTLWPCGAGVAILLWRGLRMLFPDVRPPRFITRFGWVLFSGVIVGLAFFLVIEGLIVASAFPREPADADWIVVLGAGLRGDKPSLTLAQRLNKAIEVSHKYPHASIIVSGGRGPMETTTEAEVMARYLTDGGIDPDRIQPEDRSTSTIENLVFSRKIMQESGADPAANLLIISSEFHLFRVNMLARRVGLAPHLSAAHSPWYLYPNSFVREFLALAKSYVVDRP